MPTTTDPLAKAAVHRLAQILGADAFSRLSPAVLNRVQANPLTETQIADLEAQLAAITGPGTAALRSGGDLADVLPLCSADDEADARALLARGEGMPDTEFAALLGTSVETLGEVRRLMQVEVSR